MEAYTNYIKVGDEFQPIIGEATSYRKLPPAVYNANYDPERNKTSFQTIKITHDQLVDLPGTAYDEIIKEVDYFLTKECQERYEHVGLLHKMNILLFGTPGGGKSCIVNRVAHQITNDGGIVLFNPNPLFLPVFFQTLDLLQPETRVLVIFEELDEMIEEYGEGALLHILDGEIQKKNAMYIATTNYLDRIPDRIKRPGRFPVLLEVGLPGYEARISYCMKKLNDELLSKEIADATEGFTIDQIKEVIRSFYCMKKPLDFVISSLTKRVQIGLGEIEEDIDDNVFQRHQIMGLVNSLYPTTKTRR